MKKPNVKKECVVMYSFDSSEDLKIGNGLRTKMPEIVAEIIQIAINEKRWVQVTVDPNIVCLGVDKDNKKGKKK